jgi:hypothetical protein
VARGTPTSISAMVGQRSMAADQPRSGSACTSPARSAASTTPTLVRSSRSGMYQIHPSSKATEKMLPLLGLGSLRPPAK